MRPFREDTPAAEILTEILSDGPPSLGPSAPKAGPWRGRLDSLSDAALLGVDAIRDPEAAAGIRAGLLLLADDLDGSHTVSQSIPTADGSFWHGIMHRREPDYGNSKYWFRRVGSHPVYETLGRELADRHGGSGPAAEVSSGGSWDPFVMVDLVEACERGRRDDCRQELVDLQQLEMLVLLAHCYQKAIGDAP